MANRIFELPQTKGVFEVRGIVKGTNSNRFFTEKITKNKSQFAAINFGVEYDKDCVMYVELNGMPRDKVYFCKRVDGKTETKSVPWNKRNDDQGKDWRMIGINIGLERADENSNTINNNKVMAEYDAVKYIANNLNDGTSVYIKGNIEYESYLDKNNNTRRKVKYVPNQISLCNKDIDFDEYNEENNEATHAFTQTIVFAGIEKEKDFNNKETGRYVVSAKTVSYNNVNDAEYIIVDSKLANLFRKNLKPYTSIEVSGNIQATHTIVEDEDKDIWGQENKMKKVKSPSKIELIITGADGKTCDANTYNQNSVEDALNKIKSSRKAKESFGEKPESASVNDWGAADDDEDEPW